MLSIGKAGIYLVFGGALWYTPYFGISSRTGLKVHTKLPTLNKENTVSPHKTIAYTSANNSYSFLIRKYYYAQI